MKIFRLISSTDIIFCYVEVHRNNLQFAPKENPFEHVWEGGEVSPFQLQKGYNEDSTSAEVTSLLRRLINLFIISIPNES